MTSVAPESTAPTGQQLGLGSVASNSTIPTPEPTANQTATVVLRRGVNYSDSRKEPSS